MKSVFKLTPILIAVALFITIGGLQPAGVGAEHEVTDFSVVEMQMSAIDDGTEVLIIFVSEVDLERGPSVGVRPGGRMTKVDHIATNRWRASGLEVPGEQRKFTFYFKGVEAGTRNLLRTRETVSCDALYPPDHISVDCP